MMGTTMHIISRKMLVRFWTRYPDAEPQLDDWFKSVTRVPWQKWSDVCAMYPKASTFECCLIFNICGGSYRLVVCRSANWKTLFVVGVFTHQEYDRDLWKGSCECY